MTTEESEKKLKIIKDTAINCSTLELAKQVLSILHQLGLKWCTGIAYTKCTDWDKYKENTIYYPFEGRFASLKHFQQLNGKIISAEEFITLHTEKEEFDLKKYEPKGQLEGFPKEIIKRILDCQEEQGNKRDISVFEKYKDSAKSEGGFSWDKTKEKDYFWHKVINDKNFNVFFEKYPKKEDNQEFRVGDKVYDILCKSSGIITNVSIGRTDYPLTVELENGKIINSYTIDGRLNSYFKTPQLLHHRDDYNYDIIDFNNLPQRQEPKRWRAEEGGCYHFVSFDERCWFYSNGAKDNYASFDNNNYNSGNYFRTEVEAENIAQILNTSMKQLIKEEHEHERN